MLEFLKKVRDGAVNMGYAMITLFVANLVLKYMMDPMGVKWTDIDFVGISLLMAVFIALGFYVGLSLSLYIESIEKSEK